MREQRGAKGIGSGQLAQFWLRMINKLPLPCREILPPPKPSSHEGYQLSRRRQRCQRSWASRLALLSHRETQLQLAASGNAATVSSFRSTSWAGGSAPRFGSKRGNFNFKLSTHPCSSAQVRSWWPIQYRVWGISDAEGFGAPGEINWDFPRFYQLASLAQIRFCWNARGFLTCRARFEDAAERHCEG